MRRLFKNWFQKPHKEITRIKELRDKKQSDIDRWSKGDVMHDNWQERTLLLSQYIKDGSEVIEFGAGNAVLQNTLNDTVGYQPVDIVKRKENYLTCDLNKYPLSIDLSLYDTAVFSGVLEYVYDLESLLQELFPSIDYLILSYACKDICKQNRLQNGWLSDYTTQELESLFAKYSYKIMNQDIWKEQTIYFLAHE